MHIHFTNAFSLFQNIHYFTFDQVLNRSNTIKFKVFVLKCHLSSLNFWLLLILNCFFELRNFMAKEKFTDFIDNALAAFNLTWHNFLKPICFPILLFSQLTSLLTELNSSKALTFLKLAFSSIQIFDSVCPLSNLIILLKYVMQHDSC